MKERLKQLRIEKGLTQQEFADKIGIQRSTYAKYEIGRNEPIDAVIKLICDTFHVNEEWLRNGTGEMFIEIGRDEEIMRMVEATLTDESAEMKRRLVAAILRLSPEQIRVGLEWIKTTFNLVDAADQEQTQEQIIDQKVASYRAELEAEAASGKLGASRTTAEEEA